MCGLLSCCQLHVFPYLSHLPDMSPLPDVPLPAAHCTESFFKAQSPVKPSPVLLARITQGFPKQFVGFTRALVSVSSTEDCGLTPSYARDLLPFNDQFLLKQRPSLFLLCTSHSAHPACLWAHSPPEVKIIWEDSFLAILINLKEQRILHKNMCGELEMQDSTEAGRGGLGKKVWVHLCR